MIKLLFMFVISMSALADHHESFTENRGRVNGLSEQEFNFRIFKKVHSKINLLGEFRFRAQADNDFRSIRTGFYYRAAKNWKLGFFYARESGWWHDDDWFQSRQSPDLWEWKHTDDRVEQIYTADITYRTGVVRHLVFELKNRFNHNSFNHHQFLRLRPGLTYFMKKNSLPYVNIYLQHETYHPLSGYSDEFIYEQWTYLGSLFHFEKGFKMGPFIANKEVFWESGTVQSTVLGLSTMLIL